jgi:signal transduction histidine kinase
MFDLDNFEELNETLLELKRSKEREKRLAEENRVILSSLTTLSSAENKQQIFDELNTVLGRYISFNDFVVISKNKEDKTYTTFLSSNPDFKSTVWGNGTKFIRVLEGECILLFNPQHLDEFEPLPDSLINQIQSALITGIEAQTSDSVLLLLGKHKGQFNLETKTTLMRFRPLIERAISEIEHKEDLQKLVDSKTRDLLKAQKLAENANRSKSQFLAMMSHELRTPLSAVLGLIDILRQQAGTEQIDLLERMESSAELLLTIISDILDFSLLESGHFKLQRHWSELERTLSTALQYHQKSAEEKGIQFKLVTSISSIYQYRVDTGRITQILFNIVGNAIKFTQKGGVTVTINAVNKQLLIEVTDTGIGIANNQINKLFTPFVQADSTITRNYGGTGLGLAITKHLVELMKGSISIHSTLGKGSTFTITLPLEQRQNDSKQKLEADHFTALIEKNILVVEDTKTNQIVIQLLLQNLGCIVSVADNGLEAVNYIKQGHCYDLILMDISMPVMDGIEATQIIRKLGVDTPIVALTAHSMEEGKQNCFSAGMNDMVMKPIRSKEMAKMIKKFLD